MCSSSCNSASSWSHRCVERSTRASIFCFGISLSLQRLYHTASVIIREFTRLSYIAQTQRDRSFSTSNKNQNRGIDKKFQWTCYKKRRLCFSNNTCKRHIWITTRQWKHRFIEVFSDRKWLIKSHVWKPKLERKYKRYSYLDTPKDRRTIENHFMFTWIFHHHHAEGDLARKKNTLCNELMKNTIKQLDPSISILITSLEVEVLFKEERTTVMIQRDDDDIQVWGAS